jgi:hypothetical protein
MTKIINYNGYDVPINENWYFNSNHIKDNPSAAFAIAAITSGPIIVPMCAAGFIKFIETRNIKSSFAASLKAGAIMTGLMSSIMVLTDIFEPQTRSPGMYRDIIDSNHFALDYILSRLGSPRDGRNL